MHAPLIPTLRSVASTMTPALAKVAETVLNDPGAVIYQSITELAESCGASEGSIMRFCRDQGFVGFQDFKLALARELATREQDEAVPQPKDHVQALIGTAIIALQETERLLNRDKLGLAAEKLAGAAIINAFGSAASAITTKYLEYKLLRIGMHCRAFEDSHLATMAGATADAATVYVVVSSSGSTKEAVAIAEIARTRGAYVIGITNRAKSPLAGMCDLIFVASWPETPHTGGAFPSKISQLLIVDALLETILDRAPERRNYVDQTAQSVTRQSF